MTDSVADGIAESASEAIPEAIPEAGQSARPPQARFGAVFAVVTAGIAVVNLDLFIVNVALPSIGRAFTARTWRPCPGC